MTAAFTRLGRYEIRAPLGAGGMGEVFLAWDPELEREVAVKVLRDKPGADRAQRFLQEARAASALHHPNVGHVYEIGSHEDLRFIAMELIEGETLRARLRRGPMPLAEALSLATQIASALAAAHRAGIIHRDVKPENVMVTPEGYAKVVDFGLAKLRERGQDADTILKTREGVAMGTLGYMAPEQLAGGEVTPATDVYALGVVLREMAPKGFERIIARATQQNPEDRYRDSSEVHEALGSISLSIAKGPRRHGAIAAIAAAVVVIAVAGWLFVRNRQRTRAMSEIAKAERLLQKRDLAGAYEAAMLAAATIPTDPRVTRILAQTSTELTFESEPPGATVYLQRLGRRERTRAGVTPLKLPRVTRAEYFVTVEKPGYATVTGPMTFMPIFYRGESYERPVSRRVKLAEAAKVPEGMVFVEGGEYRLGGFQRPSDRLVRLSDFVLDQYEVSNRDFEAFIRAGGYRRKELWKQPFVDGGRTLTFDEAMARFRDTTGLPAPRSWSGGVPAAGREDHPVTDVTWYEAAAFAEWKGKKLPTVHQWEKAARPPLPSAVVQSFPWGPVSEGTDATERANFLGQGTVPVRSMPEGASPAGAHHMAGNVSEWCRNPVPPGYAARGGSWSDNVYSFGLTVALPTFYSAPTLGFRCVKGSGEEGDFALSPKGFVPSYTAVDDATYATFKQRYQYEHTPLNARIVEKIETRDWTREKVAFEVAGKTVTAYLYLPKGFSRPLQVIQYAPAGDVVSGNRTLPHSIERRLAPLIRGGRAVFSVELEGFLGRPRASGWVMPESGTEEYADFNVGNVREMLRGLDYVASRPDLDASRIALVGISAGGGPGVFAAALDDRYRTLAFAGTGISLREEQFHPAAKRTNFISHIRAPKLMLQGRYDEDTSLASEAEPMFRLMTEPKKFEVYEGTHSPPDAILVPSLTKWLDETMGKVGG